MGTFDKTMFHGKVVVVSGGTSGIGLAMAQGFVEAGGKVMALGTSRAKIEAASDEPANTGIEFHLLNVTQRPEIDAFAGGARPGRRAYQCRRDRQARC